MRDLIEAMNVSLKEMVIGIVIGGSVGVLVGGGIAYIFVKILDLESRQILIGGVTRGRLPSDNRFETYPDVNSREVVGYTGLEEGIVRGLVESNVWVDSVDISLCLALSTGLGLKVIEGIVILIWYGKNVGVAILKVKGMILGNILKGGNSSYIMLNVADIYDFRQLDGPDLLRDKVPRRGSTLKGIYHHWYVGGQKEIITSLLKGVGLVCVLPLLLYKGAQLILG